jgi:hypothetical protein
VILTDSPIFQFPASLLIAVVLDIFFYFLLGFVLFWKSAALSSWLVKKSKLDSDFKIVSSPKTILYFLFLMVGTYSLINQLPILTDKLFTRFKNEIHGGATEPVLRHDDKKSWSQLCLNNLIPLLIIFFAKKLAEKFSEQLESDKAVVIEES